MDFQTFLGEVQSRAQLDSLESALTVTRCTLTTLSARIEPDEAADLGAQLPEEVGRFLAVVDGVERFDFDAFRDRVADCGDYGQDEDADVVFHAQVVLAVVDEATTGGEFDDLRTQLPDDEGYETLFAVADQDESVKPDDQSPQ